jgi:hypothetical protein
VRAGRLQRSRASAARTLAFDHSPTCSRSHTTVSPGSVDNVLIRCGGRTEFPPELVRRNIAPPSALLFSYTRDILRSTLRSTNHCAGGAGRPCRDVRHAICEAWWPANVPVVTTAHHRHPHASTI